MYDGTRTIRDENLIESWDIDGGALKAYQVLDTSPENPLTWGQPGQYAEVTHRGNVTPCVKGGDVPDGLIDALDRWDVDDVKVDRYLRMFGGAIAVGRLDREDYTLIATITAEDMGDAVPGIDAAAIVSNVLDNYRQWADGEVYGVIVTDPATGSEASLWGVYDDGADYIKTVAADLALELRAARGETDAQESIDAAEELAARRDPSDPRGVDYWMAQGMSRMVAQAVVYSDCDVESDSGESIPTHWDVVCDRCGESFVPTGEEDDPENPDHYARLDGAECGGHAVVRIDGETFIDNRGVRYVPDGRGWLGLPDGWAMCGTCYRAWDDTTATSVTPTPSGRCPFEYGH